ncbi:DUF2975 domain-containing protein [Muricauda oceani]|uniref:DUF2975 domain-containing protein n=1 Tax=Flagellimonas oceani TaxID=2698672 RepID=A0A6G7J5G3_9FLAO|nr:DUF2975 domain-containing protein [Allomuricauda oceani]MBW8242307.1 DUF2975 domain-containing protein [Allomuricauda oceani]QII46065.1 DUF2975 domain-containing protein [Allomuricauda oceani]
MKKSTTYLKYIVNFLLIAITLEIILKGCKFPLIILAKLDLIHQYVPTNFSSLDIILLTINFMLLIYMGWLLLKLRKTVYNSKASSLFSKQNKLIFQSVGMGIIYYSIAIFIVRILELYAENVGINDNPSAYNLGYSLGYHLGELIGGRIPLLVIGIFILILADLIQDGYHLKQENDLTI